MIELLHISKTYRQGTQSVHALRDVSFSVQSGEFVAVIGADELAAGEAQVKDMRDSSSERVKFEDLSTYLKKKTEE